MGDVEQSPGKVHVLPPLVQNFSAAHAGVEGNDYDVPQVRRRGRQKPRLFLGTEDRLLLPPLTFQANPGNRVRCENPFVHRPVQEMAQALDIAVHRGFGERLRPVALGPVLPDCRFIDFADGESGKIRQKQFQAVPVPLLGRAVTQEAGGEFGKAHGGVQFGKLRRLEAQLVLVIVRPLGNFALRIERELFHHISPPAMASVVPVTAAASGEQR